MTKIKLLTAIITLIILFIIGTVFYHFTEHWNFLDSFYFTGITLTTLGYGDMHPTGSVSKVFTVIYALAGSALTVVAIAFLMQNVFEHNSKVLELLAQKITTQKEANKVYTMEEIGRNEQYDYKLKKAVQQYKKAGEKIEPPV